MAERPFPAADAYEDFPQHENGIGMARTFEHEVTAALHGGDDDVVGTAPRAGFFASVEGRTGGRLPRAAHEAHRGRRRPGGAPPRAGGHRHRRVRRARAHAAAPDARGCSRRPRSAAAGGEPVLRRQHRGHGACSPPPTCPPRSRHEPPTTAISCPTSCSPTTASSTAAASPTSRAVEVVGTTGADLVRALR